MGSAPWNRSGERWQAGHGGGRYDAGVSGEHCRKEEWNRGETASL